MSRRKGDDSKRGTSKAATTAASDRKGAGKRVSERDLDSNRKEDEESEDDEDEDESEDDEDEDESEDDEDEDESEDDEDEDESEDDEDEDEGAKGAKQASAREARLRGPEEDWIPDWAPWLVLIALVATGLAGLLGLFGSAQDPTIEQIDSATTSKAVSSAAKSGSSTSATFNANAERKIEARQILVAYQGARRAQPTVTRSKQQAEQRAKEALAKARNGADFDALVAQYSDEPGAATRGGRVGRFTRRQKVKAFSDAAFALQPGNVSDVVETPFGYHVIQRTN